MKITVTHHPDPTFPGEREPRVVIKRDPNWPVLACIAGATIVAASGNPGWGWLLFVAVLLA